MAPPLSRCSWRRGCNCGRLWLPRPQPSRLRPCFWRLPPRRRYSGCCCSGCHHRDVCYRCYHCCHCHCHCHCHCLSLFIIIIITVYHCHHCHCFPPSLSIITHCCHHYHCLSLLLPSLQAIGRGDAPSILKDTYGAPVLPGDITGSISHKVGVELHSTV